MKQFFFAIIFCCFLLSACGFHPRSAADIPPPLKILYVDSSQPYGTLTTELKSMLEAVDITLKKHETEAPYTLKLTNIKYSQSNPPITTTTLAVTFTYALTATVQINDTHGRAIDEPKILIATRSISQTASQVYTPAAATMVNQELRRDIISQIYYVLISNNTRNALNHDHS